MSIESFDLYNPPSDFINNVYKYYNLLREKSPIHKNSDGSYILTRYKDLVGVYRNFKVWSSDKRSEFGAKFGSSPLFEHHTTSVVFVDPPDHTRIRKIFQQALMRRESLDTIARHGSGWPPVRSKLAIEGPETIVLPRRT